MTNAHARELRKSMTRQEVKLWLHLRAWRARGFHFQRQVPRDGGQHAYGTHKAHDEARDRHFTTQGFAVLRFLEQ